MIPPYFNRSQGDKQLLNQACKYFGKPLKGTPYKGISIKEALVYIGYGDIRIDIKG